MPAKDPQAWEEARKYTPEILQIARLILEEVRQGRPLARAALRHPKPSGGVLGKHVLVAAYRQLVKSGEWKPDPAVLNHIRMKPVRSLSGVTTITVLTKPHPCPGRCIFCPTTECMPKSYLPDEPGAARAFQNEFDPYRQVCSRLDSYAAVGHPTDKIELLILGGTWSAYPAEYQEQFIHRCFDALNEEETPSLKDAQRLNETAPHRNVGLVIETRPDGITPAELVRLRRLGVTKVQMGAQSLDDRILALNQRGHTTADTLHATALLRAAGFKIVLHWMPNLLGATPETDRADFLRLWNGGYCPDEIKIYPTQLLENSELFHIWEKGGFSPYSTEQLVELVADLKTSIPDYCRVNRVIRDIPSTHVVAGNKRTSLRQDALAEMERRDQHCRCIRCREVRSEGVNAASLSLRDDCYLAAHAEEHFLSFVTPGDRIAGYLRLSLPVDPKAASHEQAAEASRLRETVWEALPELRNAALVREVHVYGQALAVGGEQVGAAQHIGLGTRLLNQAAYIAAERGFNRLAVIAAIGTRQYYAGRGFAQSGHYMLKEIA